MGLGLFALVTSASACIAMDVDVEETLAGESEIAAKVSEPLALDSGSPRPGTSLVECTRQRTMAARPSLGSSVDGSILQSPEHRSRNGIELHGRWDPGSAYGDFEPAEVPMRFRLADITMDGRRVASASVEHGKLMGRTTKGNALRDADWAGVELKVDLLCANGLWQTFPARIDGARATGDGYDVAIQDPARATELGGASWRPACHATLEAPDATGAVPFAEVWSEEGAQTSSSEFFTFACQTSAIIKCDRMGFGGAPDDDGAQGRRQACTRMVRADYFGHGKSATAEGTLIDVEDNTGIQTHEQGGGVPPLDLEAVWNSAGAVCRNHSRIADHLNNDGGSLPACPPEDAELDPSRPDLIRSWSCAPGAMCERQYSSVFVRNVPAPGGLTQWSSVVVVNPGRDPARVKLTVLPTGGGDPLGTVSVTIRPFGTYNSYREPQWEQILDSDLANHRSSGWIALASDRPVVATHRASLREGNTPDSPVRLVEDEPFLTSPSRRLFSSFYLKNWPEAGGKTQWSNIVVNNPATRPISIQVRIHGVDGGLHTFNRALAARGAWISHGDSDWLAVPNNNPAGTGALGWVEIRSDEPVVATNRIVHRSGANHDSPVARLDDVGFTAAQSAARVLAASSFLRNIPATGTLTQWSSLVVNNPHPEEVDIQVTVHRNDGGGDLARFTKVISPFGAWNAYGDPAWTSIPATGSGGRSLGWVEIEASKPVFGTNRVILREGGALSSPVALFSDEPLATASTDPLVSWLYVKNWPAGEGLTQWSVPIVSNPRDHAVEVRVRRWNTGGTLVDEIPWTIPAKGRWDASSGPGWYELPDTEPSNHRSLGWLELIPSTPLIAANRVTMRQGTTADAPIVLYDATPFVRSGN
ncbi:ADYC domain-containing protein [Sorangium sp. So ce118]